MGLHGRLDLGLHSGHDQWLDLELSTRATEQWLDLDLSIRATEQTAGQLGRGPRRGRAATIGQGSDEVIDVRPSNSRRYAHEDLLWRWRC
jgi:hypothetical protein